MQSRFLFIALIGGVIFGAASLLFSPWRATAAGPALYLVSPQGQTVSTPQITLELWARDSTNLAAWEVELEFDATRLRLAGMQLAAPFATRGDGCQPSLQRCGLQLGPVLATASGRSRAQIGAASYGKGDTISGNRLLATLTFQRVGPGGAVDLQLSSPLLSDADAKPTVPGVQGLELVLSGEAGYPLYLPSVRR
jgi:hypothetical protein